MKVSEEAKKSEFIKGEKRGRGVNNPGVAGRHEKFQFGSNPMGMSEFEKSLVEKEKDEREIAKQVYVRGLQGVDGGKCIHPNISL